MSCCHADVGTCGLVCTFNFGPTVASICRASFRNVIVLADGDESGEAAAQDCARRWKREGRSARIARPPQGMDFNDLLLRQVLSSEAAR
ncbi:MAG: toprim domain-containing protein [Rhizobiales bacterium]|nr:toprim domain-containing protein [Hyphomicrobiales bacterium]